MSHYICTGGCHGESDTPGVCQTADCPHYQQPFEECNCEDRKHADMLHDAPEASKTTDEG